MTYVIYILIKLDLIFLLCIVHKC